jgi:thiosulfate dehydrogenase [quinone] large subunit
MRWESSVRHARATGPADLVEPRWVRALFASTWAAWIWLVVRLYLASVFLPAGWGKVTSGQWLFGDGAPIISMVSSAVAASDTPPWYASFLDTIVLPNAGLFATLVAVGELAVGVALLLGALTGLFAFGGVFLNANFVLAGALGPNPVLIVLGTLLVLAWRNAGWVGLDRWLLPAGSRFLRRHEAERPGRGIRHARS